MKRSPALAPLSRDHHIALVVALRLARARPHKTDAAAAQFVEFMAEHELAHFAVEESVLVPAIPDEERGRALAARMLEDHAYLRFAAKRLEAPIQPITVDYLHELGARLRAHVQMEEHELFPYLEQTLEATALDEIGSKIVADARD